MLRNGGVSKIKWIPFPRTERAEALYNPYCGWYTLYRFYADQDRMQPDGEVIENVRVHRDQQLCLVEINLHTFHEAPVTEAALQIVRRIFRHFTAHQKQMIVRFVYDWEGKGILNEPKDIAIILNHMSRLSPLLKEYTKNIYILQGLFIGSWGEMHSSRYLSDRNMTSLAKQLYECSGEETQIALRCPSFWRMLFKTHQPLDAEAAFTGIQMARFSLFNDGMMASEDDYGTYGKIRAVSSAAYGDKWVREDELAFQNKLCRYVSNGGEVIHDCSYNNGTAAIAALKAMRVSYLHCGYDEQVLNKWKTNRSGSNRAPWKERSAYDYITAHLGYRFAVVDADLSAIPDRSGDLKAAVTICNTGFAPCYHRFQVKFAVRTASGSEVYEYEADTDTRMWMPEERVKIETVLTARDWRQSNYILCFGIYDPRSQQPIRLADTFSAADYRGMYSLGCFITVR
jgi:hypothetical protein